MPSKENLGDAKSVLRYLKGTVKIALKLETDSGLLVCYSDSDWIGDRVESKTISGIILRLEKSGIYWKAMKQDCVALSSTEAEHLAMCEATKQIHLLRLLLEELDEVQPDPTVLMEFNCAIKWGDDGVRKSKHVSIRRNYLKEAIDPGIIELKYCLTDSTVVYVSTQPPLLVNIENDRDEMTVLRFEGGKDKECLESVF